MFVAEDEPLLEALVEASVFTLPFDGVVEARTPARASWWPIPATGPDAWMPRDLGRGGDPAA